MRTHSGRSFLSREIEITGPCHSQRPSFAGRRGVRWRKWWLCSGICRRLWKRRRKRTQSFTRSSHAGPRGAVFLLQNPVHCAMICTVRIIAPFAAGPLVPTRSKYLRWRSRTQGRGQRTSIGPQAPLRADSPAESRRVQSAKSPWQPSGAVGSLACTSNLAPVAQATGGPDDGGAGEPFAAQAEPVLSQGRVVHLCSEARRDGGPRACRGARKEGA